MCFIPFQLWISIYLFVEFYSSVVYAFLSNTVVIVFFAFSFARTLHMQVSETVLDTEGCNLLSVMSLDEVDATRTLSNDIIEVFRVLGIEACRRSLYNEIYRILESSAVNYRHLVRCWWVFRARGR